MIIIKRHEIGGLEAINKWILVYGRRKTGKTFMVRNYLRYDDYFFVKRDREVMVNERSITYDTFMEIIGRMLADGKTIVIDEFHRLGDDFLDFLHSSQGKGKIILISSTLNLSKKMVGTHSPILGLFAEFPVRILSLKDVVAELKKTGLAKKDLAEMGALLREPLAIGYFVKEKKPLELYSEIIRTTKYLVPALVGEIFTEEDRSLSATYEGILRAVAGGRQNSGEISSFLFSSKLIEKDNPGLIQPYLNNLVAFGLLKKLLVYNKRYFVYKHVSPLIYAYYYGDEKYNLSEIETNESVITSMLSELFPRIMEDAIREFLASHFGLVESVIVEKEYDIDVCLLRFQKPEIVAEVKWKKKIDHNDVKGAEESLGRINAKRKILFVPDKKQVEIKTDLEVMDISDFI